MDDIAFFDDDGAPLLYLESSNDMISVQVMDAEIAQLNRDEAMRLLNWLTERLNA